MALLEVLHEAGMEQEVDFQRKGLRRFHFDELWPDRPEGPEQEGIESVLNKSD